MSEINQSQLTVERLKQLLNYDPETGVFTWRVNRRQVRAGDVAGTANGNGYLRIRIDGVLYHAHRLAWLYVHGTWPTGDIDHRDGVTSDNRIAFLRDVPHVVNLQNLRKATKNSRTGLIGASRHGNGYRAEIKVNGLKRNLGTYATAEEAHAAYIKAKRELHPGCTL